MARYSILFLLVGLVAAVVLADKAALIIIDVQNCFLPNGTLPVPDGDDVIPAINRLRMEYGNIFSLVVLSQDWHCPDHVSFASQHDGHAPLSATTLYYDSNGNLCWTPDIASRHAVNCTSHSHEVKQTLWPDHCVIGSHDADFHSRLHREPSDIVVRKGYACQVDSYSAFFDNGGFRKTDLDSVLRKHMITSVYVTGLALDVCVYYTSVDANQLGYETYTVVDAARGITPEGVARSLADLKTKGVHVINTTDIAVLSTAHMPAGYGLLLAMSNLALTVFWVKS